MQCSCFRRWKQEYLKWCSAHVIKELTGEVLEGLWLWAGQPCGFLVLVTGLSRARAWAISQSWPSSLVVLSDWASSMQIYGALSGSSFPLPGLGSSPLVSVYTVWIFMIFFSNPLIWVVSQWECYWHCDNEIVPPPIFSTHPYFPPPSCFRHRYLISHRSKLHLWAKV